MRQSIWKRARFVARRDEGFAQNSLCVKCGQPRELSARILARAHAEPRKPHHAGLDVRDLCVLNFPTNNASVQSVSGRYARAPSAGRWQVTSRRADGLHGAQVPVARCDGDDDNCGMAPGGAAHEQWRQWRRGRSECGSERAMRHRCCPSNAMRRLRCLGRMLQVPWLQAGSLVLRHLLARRTQRADRGLDECR